MCAGISLLFCPIGFGIAGIILGGIVRRKGSPHGVPMIVVSIVCAILGAIIGALVLQAMQAAKS